MQTALTGGQCGLSEGDPESVEVTNTEIMNAIEGIIKVDDDLNSVLKAPVRA